MGSCGAYIGAAGERQAIRRNALAVLLGGPDELQQFHED